MKAPAAPTRNPLAARHLAVQGAGVSVEQQNIQRKQQPMAMAGALGPTVQAQFTSGLRGQDLEQTQGFNTQQLAVNRMLGDMQAESAAAPQGYPRNPGNPTAAAELMTPPEKAQALVDLHKEQIMLAGKEAVNEERARRGKGPIKSKLEQLDEMYGG